MLRIHWCTRIFVHISKLSWFYLGLLNYWKRKKKFLSFHAMARSYQFFNFCSVVKEKMTSGWVCGWWVMTYLLHCSFPIHQFFPSDDWHDCYAEPTTPPFSLQPPPLLPSLPLFFFILARKEGMLTQREEKKTYIYLGGTCLFLEKREVWKNPHVGLSDKPQFFFPLTRMRDWGECPIELIKYLSLHGTFNCL